MSAEHHSLNIPAAAIADENSREILRAWVANDGMHFSYRFGQWPTEVWGVFLSDILRQIVSSAKEEDQIDPRHTVRAVMDRFMDEVNRYGEELGFEEKTK